MYLVVFNALFWALNLKKLVDLYVELDVTMSTVKEGILSIDKNGILRSINKSACDILSIDRDKALNQQRLSDVLAGSDLEHLLSTGDTDHDVELVPEQ